MFKCEITGRSSRPNELCNKVVVEKREKIYYKQVLNEETRLYESVQVATGWEIVKEINVSQAGLDQISALKADLK